MNEIQQDTIAAIKEFIGDNFQSEEIESSIVLFLQRHFPRTVATDNLSEKTIVRFVSYVLKFAGKKIHNVQAQVFLAGMYGMLNMYGLSATVAIIIKMQKLGAKHATVQPSNSVK